jgi:hypothetical protein
MANGNVMLKEVAGWFQDLLGRDGARKATAEKKRAYDFLRANPHANTVMRRIATVSCWRVFDKSVLRS